MIKLTENGYVYISRSGITYDLLEGTSFGIFPKRTSDIIFIVLTNGSYNVDDDVAGYLFCPSIFEHRIERYDESITAIVDDFEKRNNLKEPIPYKEITKEIVSNFNRTLRDNGCVFRFELIGTELGYVLNSMKIKPANDIWIESSIISTTKEFKSWMKSWFLENYGLTIMSNNDGSIWWALEKGDN